MGSHTVRVTCCSNLVCYVWCPSCKAEFHLGPPRVEAFAGPPARCDALHTMRSQIPRDPPTTEARRQGGLVVLQLLKAKRSRVEAYRR